MKTFATQLCASIAACALALPAVAQSCLGDLNADHAVTGADLGILLGQWGQAGAGDLDGNGIVGGSDIGLMLGAWGICSVTVPSWATLLEAQPDPAVVTDPLLRAAIAATGLAWRVRDAGTQIEMLLVPPGTFWMGCSPSSQRPCSFDESPVHQISLTTAFYLGRFELTQSQWTARMGSNPSLFQDASVEVPAAQVADRPVESFTWSSVSEFLLTADMRLPTEAEWEFACRAGTTTAFNNGFNEESTLEDVAWFAGNSANQPRPVGQKAANRLGFHDMHGNISEWVADWYSPSYYSVSPPLNPTGPSMGSNRVGRGAAWAYPASHLGSSLRLLCQNGGGAMLGFRVARNP